jgi:hypothetical protein
MYICIVLLYKSSMTTPKTKNNTQKNTTKTWGASY